MRYVTTMFTDKEKNRITINYHRIGTVSEQELIQALITDLHMLEDEFGIKYCTGARLTIWATNEYGDPIVPTRPTGGRVSAIDTLHYRPACLDYEK